MADGDATRVSVRLKEADFVPNFKIWTMKGRFRRHEEPFQEIPFEEKPVKPHPN